MNVNIINVQMQLNIKLLLYYWIYRALNSFRIQELTFFTA